MGHENLLKSALKYYIDEKIK
ncbi:hypothetical protein ACV3RX_01360 [Clostridium perfringens]